MGQRLRQQPNPAVLDPPALGHVARAQPPRHPTHLGKGTGRSLSPRRVPGMRDPLGFWGHSATPPRPPQRPCPVTSLRGAGYGEFAMATASSQLLGVPVGLVFQAVRKGGCGRSLIGHDGGRKRRKLRRGEHRSPQTGVTRRNPLEVSWGTRRFASSPPEGRPLCARLFKAAATQLEVTPAG